jgi:hypothetical protein
MGRVSNPQALIFVEAVVRHGRAVVLIAEDCSAAPPLARMPFRN